MAAKKKEGESKPRTPRKQSLPGMEDAKIEALEELALQYADIRDQRMSLSKEEGELKGKLLQLMKSQKRETYQRDNILIKIVHEKENVKVKVNAMDKSEDEDGDDD